MTALALDANERAELVDAGLDQVIAQADAHHLVVQLVTGVGDDAARFEVDVRADEGGADGVQVRGFGAAEHEGCFEFDGRADDATLIEEDTACGGWRLR
jgi:hypothetical protein